ncbi:MAG: type II toxin-antitoxin system Phd/YefM family antitoxin [Thermoleophilaceae bacterium]
MREVGVRELKSSLSEILRLASSGKPVRVTVHGRPVADIVPAGTVATTDDRLRSLAADGRLVSPVRPRPPRAPRLVRASGTAAELVIGERDAER